MFKSYRHGLDILGMSGLSVVGHGGGGGGGGHHHHGGGGFRGGWGGWGGYPYGYGRYDLDEPYYIIDLTEPNEELQIEQAPADKEASALAAVARAQEILNKAGMDLEGVKKTKAKDVPAAKGAEVLGGYDIASWQKQMNQLKQIPVSIAQVLLSRGQQAIAYAMGVAKIIDAAQSNIPLTEKLPRAAARAAVVGKIKWHADNLAKVSPTAWQVYKNFQSGDQDAFKKAGTQLAATYTSGADLAHWVMEAFQEANAVEEGSAALASYWTAMWSEIGAAIAALPADVAKAVKGMAAGLKWGLIIGGSVVGVAGGVMLYRGMKK